ncbi:uncharacterized protein BJ212DRAFT_1296286 [Suillus subaureus]|uniref:Uncharacterized protein n=1 Tax=Suillus subaureus TaxID=48587 RepID=A0A9P7JI29_9AGAM|nr:uncharacterized protein BJ212DRAFT_1296286 [Suillus subaureus]KAG1823725.1 hypothetical protein BJ212DRAFT_1296286 [Suillus subaureus]
MDKTTENWTKSLVQTVVLDQTAAALMQSKGIDGYVSAVQNFNGINDHVLWEQNFILLQFTWLHYQAEATSELAGDGGWINMHVHISWMALTATLKTMIDHELKINNSEFAMLVNMFLCIALGFIINKFGGLLCCSRGWCHYKGLNSYHVLMAGKIIAAIGDRSLDNVQHKIVTTYFAPGNGLVLSIVNVAQYVGQSTVNVMSQNIGSYSWPLWIGTIMGLFSFLCTICIFALNSLASQVWVESKFKHPIGQLCTKCPLRLGLQFAQQRLKKGAVVGRWVLSFYLLLPIGLTPFLGILSNAGADHKASVSLRMYVPHLHALVKIFRDSANIYFAIKKSLVQGSIIITMTATGKLQDLSPTSSLDSAMMVWLVYAFISMLILGVLLGACYMPWGQQCLPAMQLSQNRVNLMHLVGETPQGGDLEDPHTDNHLAEHLQFLRDKAHTWFKFDTWPVQTVVVSKIFFFDTAFVSDGHLCLCNPGSLLSDFTKIFPIAPEPSQQAINNEWSSELLSSLPSTQNINVLMDPEQNLIAAAYDIIAFDGDGIHPQAGFHHMVNQSSSYGSYRFGTGSTPQCPIGNRLLIVMNDNLKIYLSGNMSQALELLGNSPTIN